MTVTITSLTFDFIAGNPQNVTVKYRKLDDPNWICYNSCNPIVVAPSGVLTTPVIISGLDEATHCEIFTQADCGSAPYITTIITPTGTCPNITDIETIITN